jgi:acyl-CoA synthetase (AMP-forming)/AMP-acid ligase II/acyl carrier protein
MISTSLPTVPYELSTLVELLRQRAVHQPDHVAYTFLLDGETEKNALCYDELDRKACAIGAWLQSAGTKGDRVLLLYPAGLEYITAFFGCLYAGMIAVPTCPTRLTRHLLRLQTIATDTQAHIGLTTRSLLSKLEALFPQAPALGTMCWRVTDDIVDDLAGEWRDPAVTKNTTAFLQYTSGSTADPKGVMVSHGNLLHNARMSNHKCRHSERSVVVGWLPLHHDMGLIGNVLLPLYVGIPSVLMSPMAFLAQPFRWLKAISHYEGTTSGGPNFAYDLCVRTITAEQRAKLDLSSWEIAFNGAEPIRPETLERFATAFAPRGFRREAFFPCYGLAEATLMVSGGVKEAPPSIITVQESAFSSQGIIIIENNEDGKRVVSCGHTLLQQRIVIANPQSLVQCLPNQSGEIWVSGPSVAGGYWNQPEKTKHTFHACLADTGEGPFLRTGDVGFMNDGELFVTGRLKDLIIIRGSNYHPHDIELVVEGSHPALRPGCCAAFSADVDGEERLVIVAEAERHVRNPDADAVGETIRRMVAEHYDLQVHTVLLIKAGSIPKTSSGKIQRHACRRNFVAGTLAILGASMLSNLPTVEQRPDMMRCREPAMGTPAVPGSHVSPSETGISPEQHRQIIEQQLREWLTGALRVSAENLDTSRALYSLGVDSLAAAALKSHIEEHFGVDLPMTTFLDAINIAQLAGQVLEGMTARDLLDSVRVDNTELAANHDDCEIVWI